MYKIDTWIWIFLVNFQAITDTKATPITRFVLSPVLHKRRVWFCWELLDVRIQHDKHIKSLSRLENMLQCEQTKSREELFHLLIITHFHQTRSSNQTQTYISHSYNRIFLLQNVIFSSCILSIPKLFIFVSNLARKCWYRILSTISNSRILLFRIGFNVDSALFGPLLSFKNGI